MKANEKEQKQNDGKGMKEGSEGKMGPNIIKG